MSNLLRILPWLRISYGDPDCVATLWHFGAGNLRERQIKAVVTKQQFQITNQSNSIEIFECTRNEQSRIAAYCAFLWLEQISWAHFIGYTYGYMQ